MSPTGVSSQCSTYRWTFTANGHAKPALDSWATQGLTADKVCSFFIIVGNAGLAKHTSGEWSKILLYIISYINLSWEYTTDYWSFISDYTEKYSLEEQLVHLIMLYGRNISHGLLELASVLWKPTFFQSRIIYIGFKGSTKAFCSVQFSSHNSAHWFFILCTKWG